MTVYGHKFRELSPVTRYPNEINLCHPDADRGSGRLLRSHPRQRRSLQADSAPPHLPSHPTLKNKCDAARRRRSRLAGIGTLSVYFSNHYIPRSTLVLHKKTLPPLEQPTPATSEPPTNTTIAKPTADPSGSTTVRPFTGRPDPIARPRNWCLRHHPSIPDPPKTNARRTAIRRSPPLPTNPATQVARCRNPPNDRRPPRTSNPPNQPGQASDICPQAGPCRGILTVPGLGPPEPPGRP